MNTHTERRRRCLAACALAIGACSLNGCMLLDPYAKDVRRAALQVEALEQRVSRLESEAPSLSARSGAAFVTSAEPGTAFAATAGAQSLEGGGASAGTGGRWLPLIPFQARGAFTKLTRGVVNVVTGWVEIPKRVHETSQTSGAGAGFTWGFVRGVGYAFIRTVGGAYEVVTFPFPAPPEYRPVMQPEYVFE